MPWPQCRFQSFVMHLPQSLVSRPQCHGPSATWPQCHLASVGPSAIAPFESEGHVYHVRGKQTKGSGHRVEPCLHTTLRCWQSYLQHDGRWQMASSRIVTAILGGDCPWSASAKLTQTFCLLSWTHPAMTHGSATDCRACGRTSRDCHWSSACGKPTGLMLPLEALTWFFLFEAHVNGYMVPKTSPEFSMLETFLRSMQGPARLPHWVGHFWWGTSVFFEVAQLTNWV